MKTENVSGIPRETLAGAIYELTLDDAGDLCDNEALDHELLDEVPIHSLEWFSADQRKWVLESASLSAAQIEWMEVHIDADGDRVLPDLEVCISGVFWIVCEDGIAGTGEDEDGGRVVQTLAWEDIL